MAGFLSSFAGSRAADYRVANAYAGLRSMVLGTRPEDIGLQLKDTDEVWGVLMETGYPEAVATLVALAEGTVSLYFSNGGGIIGLGPHPGPQAAARSFLATARRFSKQAQPTATYPLPKPSFTRFYLLTGSGVLTLEAKASDLGYGRHPLSPLLNQGHALITEIRQVDHVNGG